MLSSTQVTPSYDAERQLTREKLLHTHSHTQRCLSTASRAYSSEKHAPLQSAKRKQLTSGPNFFVPTHLPLPPPRPPHGGARSRNSLSLLNPNTRGFGRSPSTNQVRSQDSKGTIIIHTVMQEECTSSSVGLPPPCLEAKQPSKEELFELNASRYDPKYGAEVSRSRIPV